jgi:hypothetical protein
MRIQRRRVAEWLIERRDETAGDGSTAVRLPDRRAQIKFGSHRPEADKGMGIVMHDVD